MNNNTKYITLTDRNFQKQVLMSNQPVLVEFWADWSGPCHIVAPLVEEIPITPPKPISTTVWIVIAIIVIVVVGVIIYVKKKE